MSSQLHITNGDSFTDRLKSLNLEGEIITWREMLCEGQTLNQVGSESFWKARYEFLNKNYKVTKASFIEKTLKEYRSLCNHKKQDQIVLWFEYDLFCQINMLAVISWLKTHRKYAQISLICCGKEGESDKLFGLNELSDAQLLALYNTKQTLDLDDIEYADYVWQLYCSNNPIRLENLTDFKNYNFKYLESAIKTHLKRFPSVSNGLNIMENNMINLATSKHKISSKNAFLKNILKHQGNLGFGDLQYERALERLKPLFKSFSPVTLSTKGKSILDNKTSYYAALNNNEIYLGGALKYSFLYNNTSNRILKL